MEFGVEFGRAVEIGAQRPTCMVRMYDHIEYGRYSADNLPSGQPRQTGKVTSDTQSYGKGIR
jgi:hypothetical protein